MNVLQRWGHRVRDWCDLPGAILSTRSEITYLRTLTATLGNQLTDLRLELDADRRFSEWCACQFVGETVSKDRRGQPARRRTFSTACGGYLGPGESALFRNWWTYNDHARADFLVLHGPCRLVSLRVGLDTVLENVQGWSMVDRIIEPGLKVEVVFEHLLGRKE